MCSFPRDGAQNKPQRLGGGEGEGFTVAPVDSALLLLASPVLDVDSFASWRGARGQRASDHLVHESYGGSCSSIVPKHCPTDTDPLNDACS